MSTMLVLGGGLGFTMMLLTVVFERVSVGEGYDFLPPWVFPIIGRHVAVKVTGEGCVEFPFKNTEKEM